MKALEKKAIQMKLTYYIGFWKWGDEEAFPPYEARAIGRRALSLAFTALSFFFFSFLFLILAPDGCYHFQPVNERQLAKLILLSLNLTTKSFRNTQQLYFDLGN